MSSHIRRPSTKSNIRTPTVGTNNNSTNIALGLNVNSNNLPFQNSSGTTPNLSSINRAPSLSRNNRSTGNNVRGMDVPSRQRATSASRSSGLVRSNSRNSRKPISTSDDRRSNIEGRISVDDKRRISPIANSPSVINSPTNLTHSNIKVFLRVRPFNEKEKDRAVRDNVNVDSTFCFSAADKNSVTILDSNNNKPRRYNFDGVLTNSSQNDVFNNVAKPICDGCIAGYNGTIFAYGQTGSGKTFTIQGQTDSLLIDPSEDEIEEDVGIDERGVMPRTFDYLFNSLDIAKSQYESTGCEFKYDVKCTFVEIYNEVIYDLIDATDSSSGSKSSAVEKFVDKFTTQLVPSSTTDKPPVTLTTTADKSFALSNIDYIPVSSPADCISLMRLGTGNRHTASTLMNIESSRSHSVFTIYLDTHITNSIGEQVSRHSRFHMIDLAGSERLASTGVVNENVREAQNINKSLSALSAVILRINESQSRNRDGIGGHIPYRDSTLTKLLKDSLGGNSLTHIIACVSPSITYSSETLSTLRFTESARKVDNTPTLNEERQPSAIIAQLNIENKRLLKVIGSMQEQMKASGIKCDIDIDGLIDGNGDSSDTIDSREYQELQREMNVLRDDLKTTQNDRDNIQNSLIDLQQKYEMLEVDYEDEKATNFQLTNDLTERTTQLEEMTTNYSSTLDVLTLTTKELEDTILQLHETRDNLTKTEDILKTTEQTLLETQETLTSTQTSLRETQITLEITEEKLRQTQATLAATEDKLATTENELASVTSLLETERETTARLTIELENTTARLVKTEKLLKTANITISELNEEIIVLKHNINEQEEEISEMTEKNDKLFSDNSNLNNTNSALTDKLNDFIKRAAKINGDLTTMREINAAHEKTITELTTIKDSLTESLRFEENISQDLQLKLSATEEMYEKDTTSLQINYENRVREYETVLQQQNDTISSLSVEVESQMIKIKEQEGDILSLSEHKNMNQRINVLMKTKEENESFKKEIQQLKNKLDVLSKELVLARHPSVVPRANNSDYRDRDRDSRDKR